MRIIHWLLLPYVGSLIAFAIAFAVMEATGTNRHMADLNSGTAGFIFLGFGIVCSVVALFRFPYSSARAIDWAWLGAHGLLLGASLYAAQEWFAYHLA